MGSEAGRPHSFDKFRTGLTLFQRERELVAKVKARECYNPTRTEIQGMPEVELWYWQVSSLRRE